MPKEIYHSDPISLPEVKKLLIDRAKEGKELSYMQRIALEHAQLVSRIDADTAKKLTDELIEKYRLSTKSAITLVNYMPDAIDEIRQLIGKDATTMETETIEKILIDLNNVQRLDNTQRHMDIDALEKEGEELEEKEIDESMIPEDLI